MTFLGDEIVHIIQINLAIIICQSPQSIHLTDRVLYYVGSESYDIAGEGVTNLFQLVTNYQSDDLQLRLFIILHNII